MKRYLVTGVLFALGGTLLWLSHSEGAASEPTDGSDWEMVEFELDDSVRLDRWLESAGVTAQTVFFPDERIPINETTEAPWRSVVLLVMLDEFDEFAGHCTGSLVNHNVVLTAAHCVWTDGGYVSSVLVVPGANALDTPFGVALADRFAVPVGWTNSEERVFDFGLVFLDGAPFGNLPGPYMTIAAAPSSYLARPDVVIASAGYPGDKPFGTMWFTGAFEFIWDDELIYTEMDAYAGQSGSPIYTLATEANEVFVVGVFSAESFAFNIAVRFSPPHLEALEDYCASAACSLTTKELADILPPSPTSTATPPRTPTQVKSPTATTTPTISPTKTVTPGPTQAPYRATLGSLARD